MRDFTDAETYRDQLVRRLQGPRIHLGVGHRLLDVDVLAAFRPVPCNQDLEPELLLHEDVMKNKAGSLNAANAEP